MNTANSQQIRTLGNLAAAQRCLCLPVAVVCCLLVSAAATFAMPAQVDLPAQWGAKHVAVKPAAHIADDALSGPLLQRKDLMLIPRGRLIVGSGTIDPRDYLQQRGALGSIYSLQAPEAAVVEYTYPRTGFFAAGFPLIRLYDIGILPDLRKAEASARHYLDRPFTILRPAPVPDFPSPTASRPLTSILPTPPSAPQPLAPVRQGDLSREPSASGLSLERDAQPARADVEAARQNAADLAAQLSAAEGELTELQAEKSALDQRIAEAQVKLEQAGQDLAARESLYDRGMLAANAIKPAQQKHQQLEAQYAGLQATSQELQDAIASSHKRADELQAKLQGARAAAKAAVAAAERPGLPVPKPANRTTTPRPAVKSRPQAGVVTKPSNEPPFPDPTILDRTPTNQSRAADLLQSIRRLSAVSRQPQQRRPSALPPIPQALTRLGEPRWQTVSAPTGGVVLEQLVPAGEEVAAGQSLLKVANTQWARVYADLSPDYLGQYRQGSPILIVFDDYPSARFEGWINSLTPTQDGLALRAEIYVVCTAGYYGSDAYATLQWLAGAALLDVDEDVSALQPATVTVPELHTGDCSVYAILPIVPPEHGPALATTERTVAGEYVGYMHIAQLQADTTQAATASRAAKQRLQKLTEWRQSFTEGMTTTIFANKLVLTYPGQGEIRGAVEKMATGRVSHVKHRCARTLAEALGWSLGDAADWANGLPRKGYKLREDGLCRPGDILVWPFTYGPRRNQHVGIAVLQGGRMMTLSNSAGRLGTDEILPGYLAFHKPPPDKARTPTE